MVADTTPKVGYGFTVTWAGHDMGTMLNLTGPSIKADTVDLSNNDSEDAHKEFGLGLVDGGEISITARSIPGDTSGQKYFRDDLQAREERELVITYPDAISKWTLNALPTGLDTTMPYDGAIDITMTMKVNGKPEFTNS